MEQKKLSFIFLGSALLILGSYYIYHFSNSNSQKNSSHTPSVNELAQERAQYWGQWLIVEKFELKTFKEKSEQGQTETSRGLASAPDLVIETHKTLDGEIGRDPWGKPFHFHVQGDGQPGSKVYLWSTGANETFDSGTTDSLIEHGAKGDDLIVSVLVK